MRKMLMLILIPSSVYGWKGHSLLTRVLLDVHNVKFPSINLPQPPFPSYIKDINKFNKRICPDTFQHKSLTAREILITHVIDPDCGLDSYIKGGFVQKFMGGSQGYRHLYYPAWRLKFPLIFLPQGAAPERAKKFFNLAKAKFKEGDVSSALLFIAWALHYIEDLSQPYHTCQTSWDFIKGAFNLQSMVRYTKNFHYAYEDFVYFLLKKELGGERDYGLIQALKTPVDVEGKDVYQLAIKVAKRSSKLCRGILRVSYKLWQKSVKVNRMRRLSEKEMKYSENKEEFEELLLLTKEALKILSGSVVKYLRFASGVSDGYINLPTEK